MTFYIGLLLASFLIALCALMLLRSISERIGLTQQTGAKAITPARSARVRVQAVNQRGSFHKPVVKPWGW